MTRANGRRKTARKSAKRTQQLPQPVLIPEPDGRGALLSGGLPGNAGGTGRPPSAIREAARLMLDQRLSVLGEIADGEKRKDSDRIRAIEVLGKFGLEESVSVADVRERLARQAGIIARELGTADAERLFAKLDEVWR